MPIFIVGSAGPYDNNGWPFGPHPAGYVYPFSYQQIYRRSAFAGPATFRSLGFLAQRIDDFAIGIPAGVPTSGPVTIAVSLSTSTVDPWAGGQLSANLAANRGSDFAQAFAGTINIDNGTGPGTDGVTSLTITLATPFNYNPAGGNLLLEVSVTSGGSAFCYFKSDRSGNVTRRLYDERHGTSDRGVMAADPTGLVTVFGT